MIVSIQQGRLGFILHHKWNSGINVFHCSYSMMKRPYQFVYIDPSIHCLTHGGMELILEATGTRQGHGANPSQNLDI